MHSVGAGGVTVIGTDLTELNSFSRNPFSNHVITLNENGMYVYNNAILVIEINIQMKTSKFIDTWTADGVFSLLYTQSFFTKTFVALS